MRAGGARSSPRLSVQDLIERLAGLGLPEDEAAAFVHLTMLGPSRSSNVGKALGTDREKASRLLRSLVARRAATATERRPSTFEALPPERLFDALLSTPRERVTRIEQAEIEIASTLSTLRSREVVDLRRDTFRVLSGRPAVYRELERMLRDARRSVETVSTHPAAMQMGEAAGVLGIAIERASEGVEVRTVLLDDPRVTARLEGMRKPPSMTFRVMRTERILRWVVRDGTELLIWVVSDPSERLATEEDVAVWTDAADFVATQRDAFERLWREAAPVPGPATSPAGGRAEPSA